MRVPHEPGAQAPAAERSESSRLIFGTTHVRSVRSGLNAGGVR